jgi:hypothetical protein
VEAAVEEEIQLLSGLIHIMLVFFVHLMDLFLPEAVQAEVPEKQVMQVMQVILDQQLHLPV